MTILAFPFYSKGDEKLASSRSDFIFSLVSLTFGPPFMICWVVFFTFPVIALFCLLLLCSVLVLPLLMIPVCLTFCFHVIEVIRCFIYHLTTYRIYSNIYFFKKTGEIHFRLPPEMLEEILCHLDIKSLFRTATVCVAWEKVIWKCPQSISPFEIKFDTQRLKKFVNLTTLNVSDYMNTHINDEAISTLLKLRSLELSQHPYIRSHSQQLTISNVGVERLVNLTHLNLKGNAKITNEGIRKLVSLTSLDLSRNELVTIEGIKNLTNLSSLKIIKNNMINLDQIQHLNLPNLKHVFSDREYLIDKNKTTIIS